ncbi:hypothetical protein ENSA5_01270 [Enhygromyxa salina]|uniref:Uncharacterized protein n=1 Tax=Enhygromyxa salina TaxID=215803 RepID=A0A2S9YL13_9BACT|nr:hypothetical protein [Enhygromyxa salina]PRQ05807.1 hypothetical protein ENSA5_01270 [Enhygromyxa salina]
MGKKKKSKWVLRWNSPAQPVLQTPLEVVIEQAPDDAPSEVEIQIWESDSPRVEPFGVTAHRVSTSSSPNSNTRNGIAVVWATICSSMSCVTGEPVDRDLDFEVETEWLVIRGFDRDEQEICGGTPEWLDGYVAALAEPLDLAPATIGAYHWYSPELWDEQGICGQANACVHVNDGMETAFARELPHEHELNHVIFNHAHEPCVAVLSEGLAEYMRGTWPSAAGSIEQSSIEDVLAVSFDGVIMVSSDYHRARHFVSFLVFEFGLEEVLTLCAMTPKGSTRGEFDDAALSTIGVGLDELLASYASYPICSEQEDRAKLWECSREPVVALGPGDEYLFEIDASCAHPNAVGPGGSRYHFSYQVRILADGEYSWGFVPEPPPFDLTGAELRLEQCASCGDGALGFTDAWMEKFISLPRLLGAGDYTLQLVLPLEFAGMVRVEVVGH